MFEDHQQNISDEDIKKLMEQADQENDLEVDDDIIILTDELLAGWSEDLDAFIEKLLAE